MKIHIPPFEPMAKCNEHLRHGAIDIDLGEDVVPVVRCKDCKHMIPQSNTRYCTVWHGANGMGDDGFCNYGERRDDT